MLWMPIVATACVAVPGIALIVWVLRGTKHSREVDREIEWWLMEHRSEGEPQ